MYFTPITKSHALYRAEAVYGIQVWLTENKAVYNRDQCIRLFNYSLNEIHSFLDILIWPSSHRGKCRKKW